VGQEEKEKRKERKKRERKRSRLVQLGSLLSGAEGERE